MVNKDPLVLASLVWERGPHSEDANCPKNVENYQIFPIASFVSLFSLKMQQKCFLSSNLSS